MSRTVNCTKYGKELPGLDAPPLPGALGERIFAEVSRQAWEEWQSLQTMLINERHLNLRDRDSREFLSEQMHKFLANEPHELPTGYVRPDDAD